jgi:hypothetical protein
MGRQFRHNSEAIQRDFLIETRSLPSLLAPTSSFYLLCRAPRVLHSSFILLTSPIFVAQDGKRISESRRIGYPWPAMAPIIRTTKLVATAIATFASTDKFMILPSISLQ